MNRQRVFLAGYRNGLIAEAARLLRALPALLTVVTIAVAFPFAAASNDDESCSDGFTKCSSSGLCISSEYRCNGLLDCGGDDISDENQCGSATCPDIGLISRCSAVFPETIRDDFSDWNRLHFASLFRLTKLLANTSSSCSSYYDFLACTELYADVPNCGSYAQPNDAVDSTFRFLCFSNGTGRHALTTNSNASCFNDASPAFNKAIENCLPRKIINVSSERYESDYFLDPSESFCRFARDMRSHLACLRPEILTLCGPQVFAVLSDFESHWSREIKNTNCTETAKIASAKFRGALPDSEEGSNENDETTEPLPNQQNDEEDDFQGSAPRKAENQSRGDRQEAGCKLAQQDQYFHCLQLLEDLSSNLENYHFTNLFSPENEVKNISANCNVYKQYSSCMIKLDRKCFARDPTFLFMKVSVGVICDPSVNQILTTNSAAHADACHQYLKNNTKLDHCWANFSDIFEKTVAAISSDAELNAWSSFCETATALVTFASCAESVLAARNASDSCKNTATLNVNGNGQRNVSVTEQLPRALIQYAFNIGVQEDCVTFEEVTASASPAKSLDEPQRRHSLEEAERAKLNGETKKGVSEESFRNTVALNGTLQAASRFNNASTGDWLPLDVLETPAALASSGSECQPDHVSHCANALTNVWNQLADQDAVSMIKILLQSTNYDRTCYSMWSYRSCTREVEEKRRCTSKSPLQKFFQSMENYLCSVSIKDEAEVIRICLETVTANNEFSSCLQTFKVSLNSKISALLRQKTRESLCDYYEELQEFVRCVRIPAIRICSSDLDPLLVSLSAIARNDARESDCGHSAKSDEVWKQSPNASFVSSVTKISSARKAESALALHEPPLQQSAHIQVLNSNRSEPRQDVLPSPPAPPPLQFSQQQKPEIGPPGHHGSINADTFSITRRFELQLRLLNEVWEDSLALETSVKRAQLSNKISIALSQGLSDKLQGLMNIRVTNFSSDGVRVHLELETIGETFTTIFTTVKQLLVSERGRLDGLQFDTNAISVQEISGFTSPNDNPSQFFHTAQLQPPSASLFLFQPSTEGRISPTQLSRPTTTATRKPVQSGIGPPAAFPPAIRPPQGFVSGLEASETHQLQGRRELDAQSVDNDSENSARSTQTQQSDEPLFATTIIHPISQQKPEFKTENGETDFTKIAIDCTSNNGGGRRLLFSTTSTSTTTITTIQPPPAEAAGGDNKLFFVAPLSNLSGRPPENSNGEAQQSKAVTRYRTAAIPIIQHNAQPQVAGKLVVPTAVTPTSEPAWPSTHSNLLNDLLFGGGADDKTGDVPKPGTTVPNSATTKHWQMHLQTLGVRDNTKNRPTVRNLQQIRNLPSSGTSLRATVIFISCLTATILLNDCVVS